MFGYTHAIVRTPAKSIVNAIAEDPNHEKPDYTKTLKEFREYVKTLKNMGLKIRICPADEENPDSIFVEDTHLILGNKLIIELNPGAPSRQTEPAALSKYLPTDIELMKVSKKYTIDGGDILKNGKILYIGLSKRTQQEAIDEIATMVQPLGYQVCAIMVPQGLHLKSGMTCFRTKPTALNLDKKATHFVIQACFEEILKALQKQDPHITYFVVPPEESHAANLRTVNDKILLPTGCPITEAHLRKFYPKDNIFTVNTQQVRSVDGALTCSSLLLKR